MLGGSGRSSPLGVGRELGEEGYLAYTQTKHVHVDITQQRARHRWFDVTIPRRR